MVTFNGMHILDLISQVITISNAAATAIMNVYHQPFDVETKEDESPITAADYASNDIICKSLRQLTPDIPIISEENTMIDFDVRIQSEWVWILDPLDGTKEFVSKNDEFAINIALCQHGKVYAGIVNCPAKQTVYWAVQGLGAYKKSGNQCTNRIIAQRFNMSDKGLTVLISRKHLNIETETMITQLDTPQLLPKGSALKFLSIAEGEAHYYPRKGPTMEWDTAAPQIILEEAGGSIVDLETGAPLLYNKVDLTNPYFEAKARNS